MSHDKFDIHLTSLTASRLLTNLDSQKNNDVIRPSNEKSRDDVTLKSPNYITCVGALPRNQP